jgi:Xaa-Pro aminopeptidase
MMDKLQALREFMKEEGLAAFLVPHTDEFQGEYVSPHAERLKWLTGFTGSFGFVALTQDKAAFFTDGRYTLQAKDELSSIYEIYNITDKTAAQWVSENLLPHEKVGYDPWLFTEAQIQRYDRPLVPVRLNPIDTLWKDRPPPPQEFIQIHPLTYAGESDESKRKRIGASLKADHVLITACDSIAWLLNIRGNDVPHTPLVHSVCVLHRDGSYDLFVDLDKINGKVFTHLRNGRGRAIDIRQLSTHLKALKGECQVDPQTTPVSLIQTLSEAGIPICRERDPCVLPKALKNDVEIQGAIQTHIQDGIALCRFFAWLGAQPLQGETSELTAAGKLAEFRKKGVHFKDLSFETISGFGPHGAIIHYRVTPESDIPLKGDGLYLVDSGGQYLTGTTDVTRTLALGTPTAEQKDRYTRVLKGHIAIATAVFPKGAAGIQLDALARQFLWQIGCDYTHGTGHGVGSYLGVHEGPQRLSTWAASEILRSGMILSNEPGYYKEGEYGIRIESLVTVREKPNLAGFYEFETLTLAPFDIKLMDFSLLTEEEKNWIKAYHMRIATTLSPYVDEDTRLWLEKLASSFPTSA